MISIELLEDQDCIQEWDMVRQLSLIYDGQSDYLATTATYGGSPLNRLGWIPVQYFCPAWVGKTVGEFRRAMRFDNRHETEVSDYEFVRGAVPKRHLEPLDRKYIQASEAIWKTVSQRSK